MPIVTQVLGGSVTEVFTGTYQLCQQKAAHLKKTHPKVKFEVRSSKEAIKAKPILKP
jgi:hypothetical protein